jgi:tetratricopeptide (TPR) repeat protein
MNKIRLFFIIFLFLIINTFPAQKPSTEIEQLYKEAQFSRIIDILEEKDFNALSSSEKLHLIECLARTSQRNKAQVLLNKIWDNLPLSCEAHATAAIVSLSNGHFTLAEHSIEKALMMNPECPKALMTKMMLLLHLQQYRDALTLYEEFGKKYPLWSDTYLLYLMGIEVYGAAGNLAKIAELYSKKARGLKEENRERSADLHKNSQIYRKASKKRVYMIKSSSDKMVLPFVRTSNEVSYVKICLEIKEKKFNIILDTGNTVGWLIHSRELNTLLKSKQGGASLIQIAGEEGLLHGRHIYTEQVDLGAFSIHHLPGMYVPKPHPSYPEANLNPIFIKDHVVTLDFQADQFIIRSKSKFQEDLEHIVEHPENMTILPWYGYEQPLIPVIVGESQQALVLVETGAEDISLRLEFAQKSQMPLESADRYLATGKKYSHQKTNVKVSLGPYLFERTEAEVWPLDGFADPLMGLAPDIIIGPKAFKDKFVISFDPFEKKIILTHRSF